MRNIFSRTALAAFTIAAGLLSSGCLNEEIPFLELGYEKLDIPGKGEKIVIDVKSNVDWTASVDQNWCLIENGTGHYKGEFALTATENTTAMTRIAHVTVKGGSQIATIEVTQTPYNFTFDLPLSEYHIGYESASISIPYLTTGKGLKVECNSNASWARITSAGDGAASVSIEQNTTGSTRTAVIAFNTKGHDGTPLISKVSIIQDGTVNFLDALVKEAVLAAAGEEISLPVRTNTGIKVESSSEWCKATWTGSAVLVSAERNPGSRERTAYVTVRTDSDAGDDIARTIMITQLAEGFSLQLPISEFTIDEVRNDISVPYILKGQDATVSVQSNVSWLTVNSTDNGAAVLSVAANSDGKARTATLAFIAEKADGEAIIRNAYITQETTENELSVLVSELTLASVGDTVTIHALSNADIKVYSSSDWCKAEATGEGIRISAEINANEEDREAYVTVVADLRNGSKAIMKSIKVMQKAVDIRFEFAESAVTIGYAAGTEYVQIISTGEWKLNNLANEIPDWLTITPDHGTGDGLITLKVKTNPYSRERNTQLSFTNTFISKSIALQITQESNPDGISDYKYLGAGYDASGEYAADSYVRNMVLDINKLLEKNHVADVLGLNSTEERYIYGKTINEYQKKITQAANISGGYKGFSASVSNSFSKETLSSTENEYASFRHITKKQSYKLFANLKAKDLIDCLSDDAKNDLLSMEPRQIFLKYGTHVITGFVLGGSLDYSMSADVSVMSTSVDWSVAVSGGFKFLSSGASVSTEYGQYEKMRNEAANFESRLSARGGESQYASQNPNVNQSTYTEWLTSLSDKSKWVMVDYDGSQLIPIWEFIEDADKAKQVAAAAAEYLTAPNVAQASTHNTLKMKVTRVGYTSDDAGSTAEVYWEFFCTVNQNTEKTLNQRFRQEVPDNASSAPGSKWREPSQNIESSDNLSIYKQHVVKFRLKAMEDDTTGDEHYDRTETLYYNPKDQKWRFNSETGDVIENGGTFIINRGGGATAEVKLIWE